MRGAGAGHTWAATSVLARAPYLVECSAVTVLTFLIFEQGVLHFCFALGPINYVAVQSW